MTNRPGKRITALAALLFVLSLATAASAAAAPPPLFWQAPVDGASGAGAGQLQNPRGVAADADDGYVYVADTGNARIAQYDAWGQFVRAWGWGVRDGSAEGQVCTAASGCQGGEAGAGVGQLARPAGIAVDEFGDVYVNELATTVGVFGEESLRVQKFDSEGNFLAMWGGEVNKTSGADICTKAEVEGGDVCGAGVPGSGNGEFAATLSLGNRIAVGPSGSIFVGDVERIQEFAADGEFLGQVAVPGETVRDLALDGAGRFYLTYHLPPAASASKPNVRKLSAAGTLLGELAVGKPESPAVSREGGVYVVERPSSSTATVLGFDAAGNQTIGAAEGFAMVEGGIGGLASASGCENPGEDILATRVEGSKSMLSAYGTPPNPTLCPPPEKAPTTSAQFATAVDPDTATLRAQINPHFFTDTRYYVEYGTGKCSEGGCPFTRPASPGSLLGEEVIDAPRVSDAVILTGLAAKSTYHYRFVAQSGGGGPVYGIDPDGEGGGEEASFEAGLEASFTTPAAQSPAQQPCANDAFRTGAAATLPDCRAYEMVSPVNKENGDIFVPGRRSHEQAALGGGGLAYSSYRAFADPASSPYGSEYLARRGPSGWASESVSPPRGANLLGSLSKIRQQYKLFSPELCRAWLLNDTDSVLAPSVAEGFATLYRRQSCTAAPSYATLGPTASAAPKYRTSRSFEPELQGVSADGAHAIFRVGDRLSEAGPDLAVENTLLYEAYGEGQLRAVCILPGGAVAPTGCSAGSASGATVNDGTTQSVWNAISADGSRIFWSDAPKGQGKLYLRESGSSTTQISTEAAQFWGAADDGSVALFTTGSLSAPSSATLFEYDVAAKATTPVAGKVLGLVGFSEDAGVTYLVSEEALDTGAVAGEPNLYRHEAGGGFELVAVLSQTDALVSPGAGDYAFSPVALEPRRHAARVSADGSHAAFISNSPALAQATAGTDNTDVAGGVSDAEVYLYDAGAGELHCASCNPSGGRAHGRVQALFGGNSDQWAAAMLSPFETQLYATRALSGDGSRLYFQSFEALSIADTNGVADVYQWQAPGSGTCTATAPGYSAPNGGCISLISTGKSGSDSRFVDASADGADVFFATSQSILPQDPDLLDIYDARAGGGYPPPPGGEPECQGEACQNPAPAPQSATTASSIYHGPGNLKATPPSPCNAAARRAKRLSHRAKRLARSARSSKAPARSRALRRSSWRNARRAKRLSTNAKRCRARARAARRSRR